MTLQALLDSVCVVSIVVLHQECVKVKVVLRLSLLDHFEKRQLSDFSIFVCSGNLSKNLPDLLFVRSLLILTFIHALEDDFHPSSDVDVRLRM